MRSRSERRFGVLVVTALIAILLASSTEVARAAETANSEIVIITEDDVLRDDLYAGAIRVLVEGEIDGDLIAFTAEEVVINGSVTGSVFAVSPRVVVNGTVGGSVRAAASTLIVDGRIGRDLVVASLETDLGEDSEVGGEVLAWSWSMTSLGSVRELTGTQRSLDLAGEVGNDVDVSVGRLRIVAPLEVGGDLGFRSDEEADGIDLATVGGVVVDKDPLPPNLRVRALGLFGRLMVILFLTISALGVAWTWPERTSQAIEDLKGSPWGSWATGAILVFSPLILSAVAAIIFLLAPASASFPLFAVFAPLILAAAGLVGALSLVAGVPAVGWLGSLVLHRGSLFGVILAGSAIVGVVWMAPIVGWIVPILVLPAGLGGWLTGWRAGAATG